MALCRRRSSPVHTATRERSEFGGARQFAATLPVTYCVRGRVGCTPKSGQVPHPVHPTQPSRLVSMARKSGKGWGV